MAERNWIGIQPKYVEIRINKCVPLGSAYEILEGLADNGFTPVQTCPKDIGDYLALRGYIHVEEMDRFETFANSKKGVCNWHLD